MAVPLLFAIKTRCLKFRRGHPGPRTARTQAVAALQPQAGQQLSRVVIFNNESTSWLITIGFRATLSLSLSTL
eukprot:1954198-Rhodomonas_salina.1